MLKRKGQKNEAEAEAEAEAEVDEGVEEEPEVALLRADGLLTLGIERPVNR